MPRTLIITNDFPPRPGGIQAFVHELAMRRPADSVVVYCSTPGSRGSAGWQRAADFDLGLPFPVVRERTSVLLPTPAVGRRAERIAGLEGCDSVLFGAAAPLGLLAGRLRRAGVRRIVGLTHGHETGWSVLPGARRALHRIGEETDALTYLGDYTRTRLARALSPAAAARMRRLAPGVDTDRFRPGAGGEAVRERHGLTGRPVVVCVSRLVARKGQDTLLRAWPRILADVPGAALLLVGGGPYRRRLEAMAREQGVSDSVHFAGDVAAADLPAYYDAGDVFAMPCRTRNGGLDVEGLGIVYLEASASGLPVVAGRSGGAPDAVREGETGLVVDGARPGPTARALIRLLRDPEDAAAMGERGRAWVQREWTWDRVSARLAELLTP
ncbi:glycosyltransferase family 4 protein [Streptomonospora litoralis]|uniref:GDP-mannose-dependent alpha-(1-6)-phosphatidylinositol monomannoside mannosyltransferase n=1 Tax=Streptomonospora litoralis TaxID=2498135 RepID=A0A4P6Q151_9ACTN|nr:glycosyltransferase family 4 protein [Streptomonospora litoralis]QBI53800.1 GDP-mannose-dependent alpha-(1-6)-phosphatidylinositol monomannoside mannosyltransferase [Streptomonospora litoralis]